MRVVINHLTRMQYPNVCIAGVDPDSGGLIRPLFQTARLDEDVLRNLEVDLGSILELGEAKKLPRPQKPHVEDRFVDMAKLRKEGDQSSLEFWNLLEEQSDDDVFRLFAPHLRVEGNEMSSLFTEQGLGNRSLGVIRPHGTPEFEVIRSGRQPQLRLHVDLDKCVSNLGVTDLRLWDTASKQPRSDLVKEFERRIARREPILLSVGLGRSLRGRGKRHYLQVNNIHFKPS